MRFDDMLATILAQPRDSRQARIAIWRQLADILAQDEEFGTGLRGGEAAELLEQWRSEVPEAVRVETAASLAGRMVSPGIVAFFAGDRSEVAAAAMRSANLHPDDWIELLPELPSRARALLRHRRDLSPQVLRGLEQYEAADMILERPEGVVEAAPEREEEMLELSDAIADEAPEGGGQIRTLVEKIEAFRRDRPAPRPVPPVAGPELTEFRFEAGPDGVVRWVEGAPRGPLIGQTIAFSADALDFGVDGHAAGAFRRRAPFRDARLVVAGEGPAAGSWRISAVPFFDDIDGRFAGYRGMARRPRRGEEAPRATGEGLFGSGLAPDSLRQLIHELRTPLNAIVGFAEMIERQLLGPVSTGYRARASAIAGEAARLLQSVDDLDTAARVETDRLGLDPQSVDSAEMLRRLHDDYAEQAAARGVTLAIRVEEGLLPIAVDPIAAERMIERLLAATVGLADQGEKIEVECGRDTAAGGVCIAFSRPVVLAGKSDAELLDPGYSPEGDWPDAPALGLGFALRLVGNIAQEANGRLDIDPQNFLLRLPAKDASACSGERGS